MNAPVRQHWIPKVYLRSFCANPVHEEQIHVRDLSQGRSFKTSLDRVAVKRNFYTLGLATGNPSYAVEEKLADIESKVQPLISELLETGTLFDDFVKRTMFSEFLATLLMRTRQGLQGIHGHRAEVKKQVADGTSHLSKKLVDEVLALSDEGMRELFARSVLALSRPLSKHFLTMHWRLLRAEEGYFVTSENPLVIYNPTEERWGLGTPGSHIHLPLSPRLLLHVGVEPTIPGTGTFPLVGDGVKGINGLTLLSAERYLMSHRSFEGIADLLADREPGHPRAFGPAAPNADGRREI